MRRGPLIAAGPAARSDRTLAGRCRAVPVWERLPLSARARRLLLEGDVEGRYVGRDDPDSGYRLTMALAVACSQPGRAWMPADFHAALIYAPTAGGRWARQLRERKGTAYAENKLDELLDKARAFVAASGTIGGRGDALEVQIAQVRRAVEAVAWSTRDGGDTDHKNLAARLELCVREGGLEHTIAVRPLAEQMGCARSTAEHSDARLLHGGWLVRITAGTGKNHGTRWRLRVPPAVLHAMNSAAPGQLPTDGRGGQRTVPDVHSDTSFMAALMAHDAFHRFGHGTSGVRLLSCLDVVDGLAPAELQAATKLHRTTVRRKLAGLVDDGLVTVVEDLYYLAPALAGEGRVRADAAALSEAAARRGTGGMGERRRRRHARERANYQQWLLARAERSHSSRTQPVLVPEGVVDPVTGELLDVAWQGWDLSDVRHPVWRPDLGSSAGVIQAVVA